MRKAHSNGANVRNKWPKLQFKTLDAVTATENWLQPEGGQHGITGAEAFIHSNWVL